MGTGFTELYSLFWTRFLVIALSRNHMPLCQPTLANSVSTELQHIPTPVQGVHPQKWTVPGSIVGEA